MIPHNTDAVILFSLLWHVLSYSHHSPLLWSSSLSLLWCVLQLASRFLQPFTSSPVFLLSLCCGMSSASLKISPTFRLICCLSSLSLLWYPQLSSTFLSSFVSSLAFLLSLCCGVSAAIFNPSVTLCLSTGLSSLSLLWHVLSYLQPLSQLCLFSCHSPLSRLTWCGESLLSCPPLNSTLFLSSIATFPKQFLFMNI